MASMYGNGLGSSMQKLGEDIGKLGAELTSLFKDKADVSASDIKQRVQRLRDDFEEVMSETSSSSRELMERANLDGFVDSIEATVRARPWTMLAIATGLGALASQAWPAGETRSWPKHSMKDWTGRSAGDLYQRTRDNIGDAISKTSSRGAELMEQAHLDDMADSLGGAVRARPWMMLAVAAGLGVLASQAWSSAGRSSSTEG